ncbi:MAG: hypothetical protein JJU18_05765 [Oceanicaulis sp.]|nr:hypothetical protein [Oceanicaulis sp.]
MMIAVHMEPDARIALEALTGSGALPEWAVWAGVAALVAVAVLAVVISLAALNKTQSFAARLNRLNLDQTVSDKSVSLRPLQQDQSAPPAEPTDREDYRRLYDAYMQLTERVRLLEEERNRLRDEPDHAELGYSANDAEAGRASVHPAHSAGAASDAICANDVRERTRLASADLTACFERPYPLQSAARRIGAKFFRLSSSGELVGEDEGGPHSDRWFMAVPDSKSSAYTLHFGPRVMRERTKLRVSSQFIASLEAYFDIQHGYHNLEQIDSAVVELVQGGAPIILDRGSVQA